MSGRLRTAAAAGLVALAVLAALYGWARSGWRAARAEQRAILEAPARASSAAAQALAGDLDDYLDELRRREDDRPYYQYQNLFHDPRGASEGSSVNPSPLASAPGDRLIATHFQIDARGRVSVPTINEDVPELSAQAQLTGNLARLGELRAAAPALSLAPPLVVAQAAAPPSQAPPSRMQAAAPSRMQAPAPSKRQVQRFESQAYAQNAMPNLVYQEIQAPKAAGPAKQAAPAEPRAGAEIEVATDPFEWRTVRLAGVPRLVAVRRVDTPDGAITQGFVLSDAAARGWLGERRGAAFPVALAARAPDAAAPGEAALVTAGGAWTVALDDAASLATARAAAALVPGRFLGEFVPTALLALAAGALVVLLVARSERQARQRSQFAAAAAHELRTPLAGLVLYGEMLADGLGHPARARDYARRVADEASRLGRVVANVLGFTQLERGALELAPRAGDAAAALRDASERARPALEHAGVTLIVETAEAAAVPACFDADAVARILSNLLDNAEKYSRGAASREVRARALAAPGGGARLEIADAGPGVPRVAARRLFRAFYRAPSTSGHEGDRPAGLGLGLALARALARAQGGELVHRASPGGGATFVLALPPVAG